MYVRFFRWASDRIHDNGIIAFITNRSFIDAGNFDGFRRAVAEEFDDIYIIDLGGDWKKAGSAGGGNVFGIGTGVAIGFWVRKSAEKKKAKIRYTCAPDGSGDDKLAWLDNLDSDGRTFNDIDFSEIVPQNGYWVDNPEHKFTSELPIASKDVKNANWASTEHAIFKLFSLGVSTNRDEWLYDLDRRTLEKKIRLLISGYGDVGPATKIFPDTIKWSETLKRRKSRSQSEPFVSKRFRRVAYRPFVDMWFYQSPLFVDRPGLIDQFFPVDRENVAICFSDINSRANYCVLATDRPTDLHFGASSDGYQQVAKYRYDGNDRYDNLTDWALKKFKAHYERTGEKQVQSITKDSIFNYIYGVLYDPIYREKYALNLKRAFPQIPLYADFWYWSELGRKLLKLHVAYESVVPWPLERHEVVDKKRQVASLKPATILKAAPSDGSICIDSETFLTKIPPTAWRFRLGNRSALEWVLDQHKESEFSSKLLRDKIESSDFAAHKERVIDLLCKITRVSVETQEIVEEMRKSKLH